MTLLIEVSRRFFFTSLSCNYKVNCYKMKFVWNNVVYFIRSIYPLNIALPCDDCLGVGKAIYFQSSEAILFDIAQKTMIAVTQEKKKFVSF